MQKNNVKHWFKYKNYTHLTPKISSQQTKQVKSYVKNKEKIANHAFYPLIHTNISQRKFRPKSEKIISIKTRDIYYATHIDSQIYSYYSHLLTKKYECSINNYSTEFCNCITAYRRIKAFPNSETNFRNKCNIDFAHDVFEHLKKYTNTNKVLLAFDIKGFFDNLDHKLLKKQWKQLYSIKSVHGGTSLPKDHYNVYKSLIKFSYVEMTDLLQEFREFGAKKIADLRNKEIDTFCKSPKEFRNRVRNKGLIKRNKLYWDENTSKLLPRNFGIPQGTPISANLANIYLLDFDKAIFEATQKFTDALYRRYSDDIVVICDYDDLSYFENLVLNEIKKYKLVIQEAKTECFKIERCVSSKDLKIYKRDSNSWRKASIQYLGFEFDGKKTYIRSGSLSKYYRETKKFIRRKAVYAMYSHKRRDRYLKTNPRKADKINTYIYTSQIFRKRSHLGSKRKTFRQGNKLKRYRGNYFSYALRADEIMGSSTCRKQLRRHIKVINQQINYYKKEYDLPDN